MGGGRLTNISQLLTQKSPNEAVDGPTVKFPGHVPYVIDIQMWHTPKAPTTFAKRRSSRRLVYNISDKAWELMLTKEIL